MYVKRLNGPLPSTQYRQQGDVGQYDIIKHLQQKITEGLHINIKRYTQTFSYFLQLQIHIQVYFPSPFFRYP